MRVINGTNRCIGRVEAFHEGNWKRVCSSDWTKADADVVCREINCGTPVTQTEAVYFGETRSLGGLKANCFGNESSISKCLLQDFKESCTDAIIFCSSKSSMCSNYITKFVLDSMWVDSLLFHDKHALFPFPPDRQ